VGLGEFAALLSPVARSLGKNPLTAFILSSDRVRARSIAMKPLQLDELIIGSFEGPHLRLQATTIEAFDRNKIRRFRVVTEGGRYPTLELCDGNGNARVAAGVYDNGAPYLVFRDGAYTARVELAMDEDQGDVTLIFCDRNETRVFSVGDDQECNIQRRDEHGNMVPWTPAAKKED
jgi:hypothetical protein